MIEFAGEGEHVARRKSPLELPVEAVVGDELADGASETAFVEELGDLAHFHGDVGDGVAIAFGQRDEQSQQLVAEVIRHCGNHAHVERSQLAVRRDEHVARVRIGMVEPVHEDLVQGATKQVLRERLAADVATFLQ